jgi:hypothetical protein
MLIEQTIRCALKGWRPCCERLPAPLAAEPHHQIGSAAAQWQPQWPVVDAHRAAQQVRTFAPLLPSPVRVEQSSLEVPSQLARFSLEHSEEALEQDLS